MSKATFITEIATIRTAVDVLIAAFPVTITELEAASDDKSCNNRVEGSIGSFRNTPGSDVVDDLDQVVLSLSKWSTRWS